MDLRQWIVAEHDGLRARFEQQVLANVPKERWLERPADSGYSIAWLVLHTAYHQDVALSTVVGGRAPLRAGRLDQLGLGGLDPAVGLGEAEVPDVSEAADPDALDRYYSDVSAASALWLASLDPAELDRVPDLRAHLSGPGGVDEAAVPWLFRMWDAKPVSFFVSWEDIGHGQGHIGEMIAIRARMGLNPF